MPNARLRTWRGCLAFVLLVSVTACGTSGNAGSRSVSDSQSSSPLTVLGTVELPSEAWPYELVFSPDGSIWVTESSSGAIARVHPDGEVSRFQIPGSSTSPGDIVVGPDGRMWFTGALLIGQVDSGGEITGWRTGSGVNIGLPNALAVTANPGFHR